MNCKQTDSAIFKLLLVQASMERIYLNTKQTYVVNTCFRHDSHMGYVAFLHVLSQIALCHEYALFLVGFVQTFTQTLRILLRLCADICTKNWLLTSLYEGMWQPGGIELRR